MELRILFITLLLGYFNDIENSNSPQPNMNTTIYNQHTFKSQNILIINDVDAPWK